MSGFLYFVETKVIDPDREQIEAWGLGYAAASFLPVECKMPLGENGSLVEGVILGDQKRFTKLVEGKRVDQPQLIKGKTKEQTWKPMPTVDANDGEPVRRWLGWWTKDPPRPEDLERENGIAGNILPDACDRNWLVPLIRSVDEQIYEQAVSVNKLPCYYKIDESGNLIDGDVLPKYAHLWNITEKPWHDMVNGLEVQESEVWPIVCEILGANYAVGPCELIALNVFSQEAEHEPSTWVAVAMDFFTWINWAASKTGKDGSDPTSAPEEMPGSDTSDSEGASQETTDQPVLT